MWCHAHGPPSQPAVSPAASPTLVQRINLPNDTRRSAPNPTIVPNTLPPTPATKPYSTAINATWAALIGSLGVNTVAAMSAATPPATAPPSALRPPTIATTIPRGEFTAARNALVGELSSDQVMFPPCQWQTHDPRFPHLHGALHVTHDRARRLIAEALACRILTGWRAGFVVAGSDGKVPATDHRGNGKVERRELWRRTIERVGRGLAHERGRVRWQSDGVNRKIGSPSVPVAWHGPILEAGR